jgi:hypothetical protein
LQAVMGRLSKFFVIHDSSLIRNWDGKMGPCLARSMQCS